MMSSDQLDILVLHLPLHSPWKLILRSPAGYLVLLDILVEIEQERCTAMTVSDIASTVKGLDTIASYPPNHRGHSHPTTSMPFPVTFACVIRMAVNAIKTTKALQLRTSTEPRRQSEPPALSHQCLKVGTIPSWILHNGCMTRSGWMCIQVKGAMKANRSNSISNSRMDMLGKIPNWRMDSLMSTEDLPGN